MKKNKTLALTRTRETEDGQTVAENMVEFKKEAMAFGVIMSYFRDATECVYPLKNSWIGSNPNGEEGYGAMPKFDAWEDVVDFFAEMQGRVPMDQQYQPSIFVDENFIEYKTASGLAYVSVKREAGRYMMYGWTWQDNRKVSPLLNALVKCGVMARVKREEVSESVGGMAV